MRTLPAIVSSVAFLLAGPGVVLAQPKPAPAASAPGAGAELPPQEVDLPFSDIIGSLDFAFMGLAEARNDRFMLGVDLTYTNVSKSVKTPFGILADKIDVTNTSLMLTGLAGYAIYHSDMARLDAVAGAAVPGRIVSAQSRMIASRGISGRRGDRGGSRCPGMVAQN